MIVILLSLELNKMPTLDLLYLNFSVSHIFILCGEGHAEISGQLVWAATLLFCVGSRDQTQDIKLEASAFCHRDIPRTPTSPTVGSLMYFKVLEIGLTPLSRPLSRMILDGSLALPNLKHYTVWILPFLMNKRQEQIFLKRQYANKV